MNDQPDGLSNFLNEYTRKHGNIVTIDEDKYFYGNQEQGSSKKNEANGLRKYVIPTSDPRKYGLTGNHSISYGTPGSVRDISIKYETLVNSPLISKTPVNSSRNYKASDKFFYNNQHENEGNSYHSISGPKHMFPKRNSSENMYLEISDYILIDPKYEPPRIFEDIDDQFNNFLAQRDRLTFTNKMAGINEPFVDIGRQINHFLILRDKFVAMKDQAIIDNTEEEYIKDKVYLLAQQVYAKILAKNRNQSCKRKNKYYKKKK
ncbi:hypothetical protein RclHR1_01120005 [Rhizophagus clarus]|uniref:Uncharacterized protein n=1 Tax=Rhizophagus clarus TaxID=94130 RepID=A0A2Z6Q3W0_9GLOM|nr:hypothetical protein RclHR1_01120005 [Rhizophagus clarus]GET04571.1 hypothetical protein GLOIN_2v1488604 [Rhizophagus clarus]